VQILTAGVLNAGSALLFERPVQAISIEIWGAAAFLGVVATAMAIGAQVSVQRFTSAVHTALIFTLEPVFAAVFSVWLQGDRLSGVGLLGAGLILAGMLVAELGPQLLSARARRSERVAAAGDIKNPSRTDLTA
jgi:drug/metabolite transporter (DMT)-like permease